MKTAYFDCFSGASGNMIPGALIDAGLSVDELTSGLSSLSLSGYQIKARPVTRNGIGGTHVRVILDTNPQPLRHLDDIAAIIVKSRLPDKVKQKSLAVFRRLAEAEAAVHRTDVRSVHFHETGAVDAIVDIVGAVLGLHLSGVDRIICSPLSVGSGTVRCEHGLLPVPAPATMALIKGFPIRSGESDGELLTPTGAAILTTLADDFGPIPPMHPETVGYGAGDREATLPNLLRVVIGKQTEFTDAKTDTVGIIETAIDDATPELFGHAAELLRKNGALDVFFTPIQMKKNRPGMLLTVLCTPNRMNEFAGLVFRETPAIGLRRRLEQRIKAGRSVETVETAWGPVRFKTAKFEGEIVNSSPEFEDVRRISKETGLPVKQVLANLWKTP